MDGKGRTRQRTDLENGEEDALTQVMEDFG